jgi:hypothetical protein
MKHPAEHDDHDNHAPSSKMVGDSTTTTTTATPTPYNTPATARLPQVGYSTATNVCVASIKHLLEDLDNDIAAETQYAKSGLLFANEDHTPAPPPPTMTPSLLPATPDLDDFVNPATLTQLHQAVAYNTEPQIIFTTRELQAAAPGLVSTPRHRQLQQPLLHTGNFSSATGSPGDTGNDIAPSPSGRPTHTVRQLLCQH